MSCGYGQYRIEGRINLSENWQPKVFLATIDKLSDYYRTHPDMIVNTADVNADGSFVLSGDNLPDDKRYYRLYLMKNHNTDYDACLYVNEEDHNFAHFILRNGDKIQFDTDPTLTAPLGNYRVQNSAENMLMQELSTIVFPSFYFYRIKFPAELEFSVNKLHSDLKQFADTCQNTLVALAAVNNTDFDEYFDVDQDFYRAFSDRLDRELPRSIYTQNYKRKVAYYSNQDQKENTPFKWLFFTSLGIIGLLLYVISRQKAQLNAVSAASVSEKKSQQDLLKLLTQKEKEILRLIQEGKSNKEIAQSQYVELSTVKSHINKIYSKIGCSSRSEAQSIANQLFGESLTRV